MKGQVMEDFIVEVPQPHTLDTESSKAGWWILHIDGVSRSSRSRVGLLLESPTRKQLEQSICLEFPVSNNEIEYEVIMSGLSLAITLSVSKVKIHSDSQLVVGHIRKEYEAKDERMTKYLLKVQESLSRLDEWVVEKIPRITNMQANALVGIAASLPIRESILHTATHICPNDSLYHQVAHLQYY